MVLGLCGLLCGGSALRAETKVELKNVHLCCGQCIKAVAGILKNVKDVKGVCDREGKTVTITAPDDKTAQAAVDALAEAGFHGETGNKSITVKADSGVTAGKVKTLTLTGVHNCCASCCRTIKETVKKVDGVTGDTAKPKTNTFTVTGDFDAEALVKALNTAGFHVKVKK
jgi:copper chaperone CopZ